MAEIEAQFIVPPATIALPIFARLLSSRIKPHLEIRLEALEHLFFNVFDVGKPAPTTDIAVFRCTLNLYNKFFY
jgi:hypothetical protein